MKKILILSSMVLLVAAGCNATKPQAQQQNNTTGASGQVSSVSVEPSYKNAGWVMYSDGAVVKVMAERVSSVEIKYHPTGTNQSEQSLGQATSLSSQYGVWALQLPKGLLATSIWAEAKDSSGNTIKSESLGNVGYQSINSYTSPTKYGFSIQYPEDLGFNTDANKVRNLAYIPVCDDSTVACVFLGRDAYKGTNFDGAGVSININKTLNTEAKCYNFKVSTNTAQNQVADVTINGVTFKSATGGDAGAGHSEEVQVYRNFHNGMCYEISRHVGQSSIGNYPEGTVKEFNKEEVLSRLQYVVDTFKFTNSVSTPVPSVSPVFGRSVTLTGTVVCLPKKGVKPGDPQTLECVIGFKETATGKYYGLKNSPQPIYDTNKKIQVTGTPVSNPESKYDVVADIEVESVKLLE